MPHAPPEKSTLPRGHLYESDGRWLWIPGELPVPVSRAELGLSVGEWLGIDMEEDDDDEQP